MDKKSERDEMKMTAEQLMSLLGEKQRSAPPSAPVPKFTIIHKLYSKDDGVSLGETCEIIITFYDKDGLQKKLIAGGKTIYDAFEDLTTHPSNLF